MNIRIIFRILESPCTNNKIPMVAPGFEFRTAHSQKFLVELVSSIYLVFYFDFNDNNNNNKSLTFCKRKNHLPALAHVLKD